MPSVEERLTSLEFSEVSSRLIELRADMNVRFAQVNGRFSELRDDMNLRFAEVSGRFTEAISRSDGLQNDVNRRIDELNRRIGDLDQRADRHFTWMVGTQVAMLLAVVGALVGAFYR